MKPHALRQMNGLLNRRLIAAEISFISADLLLLPRQSAGMAAAAISSFDIATRLDA